MFCWFSLSAIHFHSTVDHAVEKQENAIFAFDNQKRFQGFAIGPACSLGFGNCTNNWH